MPSQPINPLEYQGWDDLLLTNPKTTFFHTAAWARVLSESYGYTPLYFTIIENGQLRALIPLMEIKSIFTGKRGVSLPFTDYCEPIIHESIAFRELLTAITACGHKRGWQSFELRGCRDLMPSAPPSTTYLRHTLDLTDSPEKIFRTFRKGTKSAIKKAENAKVTTRTGSSEDSILQFCELNCITRKSHGLPPQPPRFFKSVYRHILRNGLGIVILALYDSSIIAGAVFFHFGHEAIYKYGASRYEYQGLRANNLILWNSIKYYLSRGYKHLCFGRTEPENEGLRIFKTGWGARENTVHYYKYDVRLDRFIRAQGRIPGFQYSILRKMPIPLLKIIGTMAYKHMG